MNYYEKFKVEIVVYGTVTLLAILGYVIAFSLKSIQCNYRWADSGYDTNYGIIKGCVVEVKKGKWLPEDRVREVMD